MAPFFALYLSALCLPSPFFDLTVLTVWPDLVVRDVLLVRTLRPERMVKPPIVLAVRRDTPPRDLPPTDRPSSKSSSSSRPRFRPSFSSTMTRRPPSSRLYPPRSSSSCSPPRRWLSMCRRIALSSRRFKGSVPEAAPGSLAPPTARSA